MIIKKTGLCAVALTLLSLSVTYCITVADAAQHFFIERPQLSAYLSYELEEYKKQGPNNESDDLTHSFSERFDISTEGWLYHRSLAKYNIVLSPEWQQISHKDIEGEKRKSRSFLEGYLGRLVLLPNRPYRLTLNANKNTSTLNSNFAERSTTDSSGYGATFDLRHKKFPTILDYSHLETTQAGFFTNDSTRDMTSFSMRYSGITGETKLNASYEDSVRKTGGISNSAESSNASLYNAFKFDLSEGALLNSYLSSRILKTNFSEDTLYNLEENLFLKHKHNLSSTYSVAGEIRDVERSITSKTRSASFGLSHGLYENLTTSFKIRGSRSTATGASEDTYSTGLDWDYHRVVPHGVVYVNISHKYRVVDTRNTDELLTIRDEPHVLTDREVTLIDNENVDIASIVVKSAGQVPFVEDIDYRISTIGSFIRIIRISIKDGTDILVDYKFQGDPPYDYSTIDRFYGVNLSLWKSWRVYYNYSASGQRFLRGIEPDTLSASELHSAGTELRWKWSTTRFDFRDRSSTELPSQHWNLIETVSFRPNRRISLSISASAGETKFKESGDKDRTTDYRANVHYLISYRRKLTMDAFRTETTGSSVDTEANGVMVLFEWFYRIYNGTISYSYSEDKDFNVDQSLQNQIVMFTVTRRLF